ncbi:hypothetical protein HPB47_021172, partial [Ixodes persulcatus]
VGYYKSMNEELDTFCSWFLTDFAKRSVEKNWLFFLNKMEHLITTYTPTITVIEQTSTPWFNNVLKRISNKK